MFFQMALAKCPHKVKATIYFLWGPVVTSAQQGTNPRMNRQCAVNMYINKYVIVSADLVLVALNLM